MASGRQGFIRHAIIEASLPRITWPLLVLSCRHHATSLRQQGQHTHVPRARHHLEEKKRGREFHEMQMTRQPPSITA